MNRSESVDAAPFQAWLAHRLDGLAGLDDPVAHLARTLLPHKSLEAALRQISRWQRGVRAGSRDGIKGDFPTDDFPIADVEEALFNADLRLEDIYPEFADQELRWQSVSRRPDLDAAERCDCGRRKTTKALTCDTCAFARRDEKGRLLKVVPDEAKVCPGCGGPKVYNAKTCWPCYLAAGGHAGRRHRSKPVKCTEELVVEAYELYLAGFSLRKVAAQVVDRTDYSSEKSCMNGLHGLWKTRGWPLRDRIEATREASTVHGFQSRENTDLAAAKRWRRRQRGLRPLCAGVRTNYPRKGEPCQLRAAVGSDFCVSHDPERQAERNAHLAAARERAA